MSETITRAAMMADSKRLHEPYYRQLAEAAGIALDDDRPLVERCAAALAAGDEHLKTVPLGSWDVRAAHISALPALRAALKERGDTWSLSVGVCLLKAAARAAVERSLTREKS